MDGGKILSGGEEANISLRSLLPTTKRDFDHIIFLI